MEILCLHEKQQIETFLRRNTFLHLYSIGDLDEFFWNYTTWYALVEENRVDAIAMLYTGESPPNLIALADDDSTPMAALLESLVDMLPHRFYCHISPGVEQVLTGKYWTDSGKAHYKMALIDKSQPGKIDGPQALPLSEENLDEVMRFYERSYPGNWFDPRMLSTRQYFGIRHNAELISVAGIHVYSPQYRVAALGNIATHPDFRGNGHGSNVTAKLCRSLLNSVDDIGLNVQSDNLPAIRCYEKLGFEVVASYREMAFELK